jgi:plastocyanin
MRLWLALLAAVVLAQPAWAGDLVVTLTGAGGKPVADAVVTVRPAGGVPRGPVRFAWPYRVAQQNLQFNPFVLIVPVGAEVAFPNLDAVRHHVYSFSAIKPFELKLYGKDETRFVKFDKAGVAAIGCNIHDAMVAFIRVVDTPYAAKSGAAGEALLRDLPPGPATVTVWHPYLKTARNEIVRNLVIPASGTARAPLTGELRRPPMRHHGY